MYCWCINQCGTWLLLHGTGNLVLSNTTLLGEIKFPNLQHWIGRLYNTANVTPLLYPSPKSIEPSLNNLITTKNNFIRQMFVDYFEVWPLHHPISIETAVYMKRSLLQRKRHSKLVDRLAKLNVSSGKYIKVSLRTSRKLILLYRIF